MTTSSNNVEPGSPEARALWRRVRGGSDQADAPAMPNALLIAAYLEGTLDAPGHEPVEAWMAGSAEALDLVVGARATPADTLPPVPPRLVARARALVPGAAARGRAPASGGGVAEWLFGHLRPAVLAATAAVLLAAIVGFELGREATLTIASAQPQAAEDGLGFGASADDLL
jgi:hypothetical protein